MSTFESFLKRIVESAFSVDFNSRIVFFRIKFVCVESIKKLVILIHFRSYIRSFLLSKNLENLQKFRKILNMKKNQNMTRLLTLESTDFEHPNYSFLKHLMIQYYI